MHNTKVVVTGATSMIGRNLIEKLTQRGFCAIPVNRSHCDLTVSSQTQDHFFSIADQWGKIDYVIHAAGWNGGISWNKTYPATIFRNTAQMAVNVLTSAQMNFPDSKCLSILASCSYPDGGDELEEGTLWNGMSNPTVECHGHAKRILDSYSRALYRQYGYEAVSCVLTNSYGPYDSFHPDKTKVVGALIRRFVEAMMQDEVPEVMCWGTGAPLREFIYAPDAAECIIDAMQYYDDVYTPINIGSGQEVSIKELTEIIAKTVFFPQDKIKWDTSKPDGQMRKRLSLKGMQEHNIPRIHEFTPLYQGIHETISWYVKNKDYADNKVIKW